MQLSPQQNQAYDLISAWMQSDVQRFVLAGYAGTGKSTIAGILNTEYSNVHFCAYTGKAAQVLRSKGCDNASTVHGAIYKLIPGSNPARFTLDHSSRITKSSLVIVDEFSMLPEEIINDLEKLASKVLYLGDPFQLPPVVGNCILTPDFTLTEVHRQALDSPVLRAATDVRLGKGLGGIRKEGDFALMRMDDVPHTTLLAASQVICRLNDTRVRWNKWFRQQLGFHSPLPMKGEKLICLQNNHEIGIYNGVTGLAQSDARDHKHSSYEIDFDGQKDLRIWDGDVTGKAPAYMKGLERLDYASVITCHKSQGSEYDNVLFMPESRDARLIYTGITRAAKRCIVAI